MKTLLFGLMVTMAFLATGCSDTASSHLEGTKTMKCGEGKCGDDKKCGADKKDEKTSKCGEGKCGGDK